MANHQSKREKVMVLLKAIKDLNHSVVTAVIEAARSSFEALNEESEGESADDLCHRLVEAVRLWTSENRRRMKR